VPGLHGRGRHPGRAVAGQALPVPPDLITIVGGLRRQGVGFTSLHETLDTTTPGGRLVFHVFAALAEFIRELIVSGTREGLAAARARGRTGGRPRSSRPRSSAPPATCCPTLTPASPASPSCFTSAPGPSTTTFPTCANYALKAEPGNSPAWPADNQATLAPGARVSSCRSRSDRRGCPRPSALEGLLSRRDAGVAQIQAAVRAAGVGLGSGLGRAVLAIMPGTVPEIQLRTRLMKRCCGPDCGTAEGAFRASEGTCRRGVRLPRLRNEQRRRGRRAALRVCSARRPPHRGTGTRRA
jgi:hypothetical protein